MTADVQRELAEKLPHTMGCAAHRGAQGGACICFHDKVLPRLLPTVQALIADEGKRAAAAARVLAGELDAEASRCSDVVARIALRDAAHRVEDFAAALDPSGAVDGAEG